MELLSSCGLPGKNSVETPVMVPAFKSNSPEVEAWS